MKREHYWSLAAEVMVYLKGLLLLSLKKSQRPAIALLAHELWMS
jgi:peptidoglycan/LPS O-acetylase OafA/YrhL